MLKVAQDADASNHNTAAGGLLLDEIARDSARARKVGFCRARR